MYLKNSLINFIFETWGFELKFYFKDSKKSFEKFILINFE